jgi:hypothetical protein
VRRARTTTATGVLCVRYMCPRAAEAPGACAARSGCQNCGPCPVPLGRAALPAPGAGAGGSPGACAMRAPAASPMEGTAPLLRGPRRAAVRDGHPRRDAVAQAGFPAVGPRGAAGAARARLAGRQRSRGACWRAFCCSMWGVSALSDEARAGMCASCSGNAIFEHTCRRSWRYRAAAGLHSSSKDFTDCALYLCTPGRRQTMTCVGSGALALRLCALIH